MLVLVTSIAETLNSPVTTFVLLLAIALIIPPIFERLKLPGLVGLLAAGVLFGSSFLGWLDAKDENLILLSEIGKIYLMFAAGLEIDLVLFNKTRNRSISFGILTFIFPFIGGVAIGLYFGFGLLAAALIGSLLASHTLLAYPIIQRLGVVGDEAVTITVGATIFTSVASLVVLAICLGISKGDFTTAKLIVLLGSLSLYALVILFGLKQLAKAFFLATGKDEGNQFLFVMLSLFLAAVVAQLIGVEGIIGAFLAGLSINSVIGDGPVKEKTDFLGNVLFIPMFFIYMGTLLNVDALKNIVSFIQLPLLIVVGLLFTKFLAAIATKAIFGYSWPQFWTMWSLSVPQVAATLAAALVGYEVNIINEQVFNSVILLMLITSVIGPLVTAQSARHLAMTETMLAPEPLSWLPLPDTGSDSFTVVVPVYNPQTERQLLELAAIVARYENGRVMPLAVTMTQPQMDSPKMARAIAHGHRRLETAKALGSELSVPIDPMLRIESNVPQAIYHFSREQNANLIVLGMSPQPQLRPYTLNSIQSDVLWAAHCPVVVAKLQVPPAQLKNILLPIENPSPLTARVLRFAQVIASANRGRVRLVHVCSTFSSERYRVRVQRQLEQLIAELPAADCTLEVRVLVQENVVGAIAKAAQNYDLVILRSQRRRTGTGLTLGTLTQPLLSRIHNSVILVGEPHPRHRQSPSVKA